MAINENLLGGVGKSMLQLTKKLVIDRNWLSFIASDI